MCFQLGQYDLQGRDAARVSSVNDGQLPAQGWLYRNLDQLPGS
jgi:hypothetical protein